MIDTALQIASKGAVEHAKDVAQGTLGELSDRLKDVDLPKLPQLGKAQKKKSHRGRWFVLLLGALGLAVVVAVVRRRMTQPSEDIAPDAFGTAVEEERASGAFGQRPIATPGA